MDKEVPSVMFAQVDLALVNRTMCEVEICSDSARINPRHTAGEAPYVGWC
jgi:hypothetical protein